MNHILLLNTGQPVAQVALITDGQLVAERHWPADRTVSTKVLIAITELLADYAVELSAVSRVAVFSGPGHYSALRTGIVIGSLLVEVTKADLVSITGDTIDELVKQATYNQSVPAIQATYIA